MTYGNQNRGGGSGGGGGGQKQIPWNLWRIVEVEKRGGKKEDEWIQCGVLWRMKEREGFTWTQFFTIPEGARMAGMPRNDGER